jgi:hypothetical protein
MTPDRRLSTSILFAASLALSACGNAQESTSESPGGWAGIAEKAQAEIREEMATKNLDIGKHTAGVPGAQLSPQGDLLIDGKAVALEASQRALLLEYRTQLAGIAEDGAAVGLQAAELAGSAMKEAAAGLFTGDSKSIEERVLSESGKVQAAARALCDRLPKLLETQRLAAEAIPEFRPYATMTEEDVRKCGDEI